MGNIHMTHTHSRSSRRVDQKEESQRRDGSRAATAAADFSIIYPRIKNIELSKFWVGYHHLLLPRLPQRQRLPPKAEIASCSLDEERLGD